jgi:hypothetical protein
MRAKKVMPIKTTRSSEGSGIVITPAIANRIKKEDSANWIYITPTGNHWAVRVGSNIKASHVYATRASALRQAKQLSHGGQILIYNNQGEVSTIVASRET